MILRRRDVACRLPTHWLRRWDLHPERVRFGVLPADRREGKRERNHAAEDAQPHAKVLCPSESRQDVGAAVVDARLDGGGESQRRADAVVDDGDDQAGRDALVLLCDAVAQDDRRCRVAHVHAKRHDEDREEGVAPVDLMYGGRGHEEAAGEESHHGYKL